MRKLAILVLVALGLAVLIGHGAVLLMALLGLSMAGDIALALFFGMLACYALMRIADRL
jgi:hypothetical protein